VKAADRLFVFGGRSYQRQAAGVKLPAASWEVLMFEVRSLFVAFTDAVHLNNVIFAHYQQVLMMSRIKFFLT
jgi:hypothetical protein